MKIKIKDSTNKESGSYDLPTQFNEDLRKDLIKKVVVAIESNMRAPYGSDPKAGQKHSAELSRRRRKYRGSYGFGISRVPRKILSRQGTRFNWVGAQAPGTVGGRKAHAPKAEKIWDQKINKKENRKAIRSALSATVNKETVLTRGHLVPSDYPFALDTSFETLEKTKDVMTALNKIGFDKELKRAAIKKVRAGVGTRRNRKYKKRKGPLLVVSGQCKLLSTGKNLPGVEVVSVNNINTLLLAPGTIPGRAVLFTVAALDKIKKENMYI